MSGRVTAAHARRLAQLALGCTTMGIGVAPLLEARLGMDPYGVLLGRDIGIWTIRPFVPLWDVQDLATLGGEA